MKLSTIISFLLFLTLLGCNNNGESKEQASANDMDAARNFLDAALKGDYKQAANYMLQDSTNLGYLDVTKRSYQRLSPEEKNGLRTASLRFYDTKQVNDSTTITIFSNSYKNDKDTLRILRKSGFWLVDLKYLFDHDMDSMQYKQNGKIDTIQK
jgi:hypothetical protein